MSPQPNRRATFIPGLLLIIVGVWFLLRNLGVSIAGLDVLWPLIPLLFGLSFLAQFFLNGRPKQESGLVFTGTAATLTGAFFLMFTLGRLRWSQMDELWPVWVLIASVAFFAQWLANPTQRGVLIPGAIALLVGALGLAATQRLIDQTLVRQVARLWPALLIVGGMWMVVRYFQGRNVEKSP